MRPAITLKGLAKVIDITIDIGYTILIHRNPSHFFFNEFFFVPLYQFR
jgi:hypothetical protein